MYAVIVTGEAKYKIRLVTTHSSSEAGEVARFASLDECAAYIKSQTETSTSTESLINQSYDIGNLAHLPMTAIAYMPYLPNETWKIAEYYFEVKNGADPEAFGKSIRFIHEFHDALRLRFVRDDVSGFRPHGADSGWIFSLAPADSSEPFLYIDLSDLDAGRQDVRIEEIAQAQRNTFDVITGPVIKLIYFNLGPERPARLRLIIHHMLVDSYAMAIVFEDLYTAYRQISQGQEIHLTKTTPYRVWAEKMYMYVLAKKIRLGVSFLRSLPWSQVRSLPRDYPEEMTTNASVRAASSTLNTNEFSDVLRKASALHDIQFLDILIAALALVLARWSRLDLILIAVLSHGRDYLEDVDVHRTVGCMNVSNREVLRVDTSLDLIGVLHSIREQRRNISEQGKLESWIACMYWREISEEWRSSRPHALFNYQVVLDNNVEIGGDILESILIPPKRGDENIKYKPWSTLSCRSFNYSGEFTTIWSYSELLYKHSTIQELVEQYITIIRSMLASLQELTNGDNVL
jgi:hypothetical protein